MSKKNDIDWNEWRAALCDLSQKHCDVIPPGWITPEQFSASSDNKVGESHARRLLVGLFRIGRADRKKFKVDVGDSGIRGIWHYRLLKK